MNVVVDGKSGFDFEDEPADAFAAVAVIEESLRGAGRGIVSVRMDGLDVPPQDLAARLSGKPMSALNRLEVTSESLSGLVETALRELETSLPDLPEACRRLAEVFQGERPEQGYEPFKTLAGIWGSVKARELQICHALGVSVESLELEGQTLSDVHRELNQYLGEAANALELMDCVLLGDLLEYELAPRAEMEAEIVGLLRTHAQQRR